MLIGEGQDWRAGEEQAWEQLSQLTPNNVCCNAVAGFDESLGQYVLPVFNDRIFISPEKRRMQGVSRLAEYLLAELPHFSRLSILWYLIRAKNIPLSGKLINPRQANGGLIFVQGSHMLPLDKIAMKYGNDTSGFLQAGKALGAQRMKYGDASVKLMPFPRIPLIFVLWRSDEEFPSRADILLDAACSAHLPPDIIWSTAMMGALLMLR